MRLPRRSCKVVSGLFGLVFLTLALRGNPAADTLSFMLDVPNNRSQEARIIADQLAEVGIHAEIKIWDKSQLREAASKGMRQAYLTDWGSSFFDPYDLAVPKLSTGGLGNFSFYSNPRVDELLTIAGSSMTPRHREKAYQEVQKIIYAQNPWVFGYTLSRFEAESFSVQGYTPSLDGRIHLHDVRLARGDELIVVLNTHAFLSLDPAAYRDRETETVVRNLFDALVTRTPQGKVVLELAESYETPDPTIYIFTLRPTARFHHGDPVTAADVAFTFHRVLNPYGLQGKSSPRRDLLGPLERVEAVGDRQVRFVLERSFPLFLQALVHFQIIPERYIRTVGEAEFARKPVGTGPFLFLGGTVDTELILERFDAYYGGSPDLLPVGPAGIRRVIFRPMPDVADRLAVLSGPTAAIVQDIPGDRVEAIRYGNIARVRIVEGTRSFQMELNNVLPPFHDIRLRKAVGFSIDWQEILTQAYHGHGAPLATCFLPNGFGFDPELKPLGRDLSAARQLLREAGYESLPAVQVSHGMAEEKIGMNE